MAVNAVKLYVKDNYKSDGINVLENAIIFANEKIYDKARCGSEYKGMGTTLVAAFVYEDNVIVAMLEIAVVLVLLIMILLK